MPNLPLMILFWAVAPLAIYRSKRRWKTFLFGVLSWFGIALVLALAIAFTHPRGDAQRVGGIAGQVGMLCGVLTCVWHSKRTRQDAALAAIPARPSVMF